MRYQKTLKNSLTLEGIGVHGAEPCTLSLHPAEADHGLVFYYNGSHIPALWHNVSDTKNATTLSHPTGIKISMVEHLLAACYGMGISNLLIECSGPEVPILDGSALPFAQLFLATGLQEQARETSWVFLKKTSTLYDEGRMIRTAPGAPIFSSTVSLGKGQQTYCWNSLFDDFSEDLAPARTFAQLKDIDQLRESGLIKGGSLDSALVLDAEDPVNPGGFRLPEECARHKLLDLIGDLATIGHRFYGKIDTVRTGHTLNHRMISYIMQHPDLFEILSFRDLPLRRSSLNESLVQHPLASF